MILLILDAMIVIDAVEMLIATWLYSRRSWSDTDSGKVFLGLLVTVSVMLSLLAINQLVHLPDPLWVVIALGVFASTTACLLLVIRTGQPGIVRGWLARWRARRRARRVDRSRC